MIGFNFTYMRYNVQFALVLAMVTGPGKGWATGCFFFSTEANTSIMNQASSRVSPVLLLFSWKFQRNDELHSPLVP